MLNRSENMNENTYQCLLELLDITSDLWKLLRAGDLDFVLAKVKKRDELIQRLKAGKISLNAYNEELVKSIIAKDNKNIEFLKQQMGNTSKAIAAVETERKAIGNFQSISKSKRNQIFSFLH